MRIELQTPRLALRRGAPGDFDALHRIASFPQVARMVASWPVPADPARTERVCQPLPQERGIAGPVLRDGRIVGLMGITRDDDGRLNLGYLFDPGHWGRGYATEMARALVAAIFARFEDDEIHAGAFLDNPASARVLEKLGFRPGAVERHACVGRGQDVPCRNWHLTRDDWLLANPLRIETPRLLIRAFRPHEVAGFRDIAGQPQVARRMLSIPQPFSLAEARDWIARRAWRGRPGFAAGVFRRDGGELVGCVGLGGTPASTMYFYHPRHHGQGFATAAHRAFLAFAFDRFDLDRIAAHAMPDNHASRRVLHKLGFREAGTRMHHRPGQLEPDRDVAYVLLREDFERLT